MEGKKVKGLPDALTEFELCKTFGCLPSELYKEDNYKIEEFLIIMNAINEYEKRETKKSKRNDLKKKHSVNARG